MGDPTGQGSVCVAWKPFIPTVFETGNAGPAEQGWIDTRLSPPCRTVFPRVRDGCVQGVVREEMFLKKYLVLKYLIFLESDTAFPLVAIYVFHPKVS